MLSKRLAYLRMAYCRTQEQVAKGVGISRTRLSHYETGRSEPDIEVLKQLACYYGVSADYLLGFIESPSPLPEQDVSSDRSLRIPLLGTGTGAENPDRWISIDASLAGVPIADEVFFVRVTDSSMTPVLCPQDLVLFHRNVSIQDGDIVAVQTDQKPLVIRKVYYTKTGAFLLPIHSDYKPLTCAMERIQVIGKAFLRVGGVAD